MASLHELLKEMVKHGATDLHITTGSPAQMRIDGTLTPMDGTPFSPNDTKHLCYSILTEAQKHRFEEDNELDLSFGIKGLSRFRANMFLQRGAPAAAFRLIPYKILTFEELGLPPIVNELVQKPRGLQHGARNDGDSQEGAQRAGSAEEGAWWGAPSCLQPREPPVHLQS